MAANRKQGAYIKFFVYLLTVVLINAAGLTLFFRIDLTRDGIYTLSDASKKVVSTLSEPLTIEVFFTRNLPAPYNDTERYLRDLLEEYAVHADRFFNFKFFDVSPEGEGIGKETAKSQALAESYGIHPLQIQVFEEDEVKFTKAYMGLVMIHGDLVEIIPAITTTDALEYKLTTAIAKMNDKISALLNLQEPIEVRLVLSSSLNAVAPYLGLQALADYPEMMKGLVEKLGPQHYGKLRYSHLDPSKTPVDETTLGSDDLIHLKWPAIEDKGIAAGEGVIGLVLQHGQETLSAPILRVIRIPVLGTQYELADAAHLEEMIRSDLEKLVNINEDLGILDGNGSLRTSSFSPAGGPSPDSISNFADLVQENYTLKTVSLAEGPIPQGLGCLVIARPTQPFSENELYQIDQALMRGTNLALFLDAFREDMPSRPAAFGMPPEPVFTPLDTGLEKLLAQYGVRIRKSIVLDENCYRQNMPQHLGGGEQPIYFAPIIQKEKIDQRLPFMKNINGLIAVKASPLELDEDRMKAEGLRAYRLISSSDKSWDMKDRITLNPMMLSPPPEAEKTSFPLACLIEGEFPSYFADKPIPDKIAPSRRGEEDEAKVDESDVPAAAEPDAGIDGLETKGEKRLRGKPAKIFVMASSEIIRDSLLEKEGDTTNTLFVANVLDALNGREQTAEMRGKIQRYNPLRETASGAKTLIKTFNIIGLPVFVALCGTLVWVRRRSRKKKIQVIFRN